MKASGLHTQTLLLLGDKPALRLEVCDSRLRDGAQGAGLEALLGLRGEPAEPSACKGRLLRLRLRLLRLLKEACHLRLLELLLKLRRRRLLLLLVGIGRNAQSEGVLLESGGVGLLLGCQVRVGMRRHSSLILLDGLEEVDEIRLGALVGLRLRLDRLGRFRAEAIARRERIVGGRRAGG